MRASNFVPSFLQFHWILANVGGNEDREGGGVLRFATYEGTEGEGY